jgi:hypothetical protein
MEPDGLTDGLKLRLKLPEGEILGLILDEADGDWEELTEGDVLGLTEELADGLVLGEIEEEAPAAALTEIPAWT